jgi:hypothetical protein
LFCSSGYDVHVVCAMSVATSHMWMTSECGAIIRHARNYDEWCDSVFVSTTLSLSISLSLPPIHNSSLSRFSSLFYNDDVNPIGNLPPHLFQLSGAMHKFFLSLFRKMRESKTQSIIPSMRQSHMFYVRNSDLFYRTEHVMRRLFICLLSIFIIWPNYGQILVA